MYKKILNVTHNPALSPHDPEVRDVELRPYLGAPPILRGISLLLINRPVLATPTPDSVELRSEKSGIVTTAFQHGVIGLLDLLSRELLSKEALRVRGEIAHSPGID